MRKNQANKDIQFIFFGTPDIAVTALEALAESNLLPALIITQPDAPKGRGRIMTAPPVKTWAQQHGIDVLQPEKITHDVAAELHNTEWDVFVVVAYGALLPQSLLDIPRHGVLNMHPSLLPRLRGPSPIQSAILMDERTVGVSIMLLDEKMDHGAVLTQARVELDEWPPGARLLEGILAQEGSSLLAETLPQWVAGDINAVPQNDNEATFCEMIEKEDALISFSDAPYLNLLKIRAFEVWPVAYTFFKRGDRTIRVQLLSAHMEDEQLVIDSVKPEGKSEMAYADFLRSGAAPLDNMN